MTPRFAASLLAAALCAGGAQAQVTAQGIAQLAWLAGCWAAVGGEPGSIEIWTLPAGGTMYGLGRTVRQGATRSHEFMHIRDTAEGLVFTARPSGQAEASFAGEQLGARNVSFHNPAHDYPQRVIYESPDEDTLNARIEGQLNGKPRTIRFPMRRTSCPTGAAR